MRKSTLTMLVLATALLIAAPAMAVTFTVDTITAVNGSTAGAAPFTAYDPSTATAGDKFVLNLNITAVEANVAVISWSVKWDASELALVAFSDGRTQSDGKLFGPFVKLLWCVIV